MSPKMFADTLEDDFFRDDFLTQYISFLLYKCGIPYQFARLFYTTIEVGILGYLFNRYVPKTESNKKALLLFIVLLGGYNFMGVVLSVRYGLGISLFLLGYYYLYSRHNIPLSLGIFIIAAATHFFFLPLSILSVILYIAPFRINNLIFCVSASFAIVFGMFLSSWYIMQYWEARSDYLEGQWGTEYFSEVSFKGLIFYYIKRIWALPCFLFFILHKNGDGRERRIIYVFALLFISVVGFATISGRVIDVLTLLTVLYLLRNYKECSVKLSRCILLGSMLYFFSMIYTNREIFFNSNNSYLTEIWKPLPIVLEKEYTQSWIFWHIDDIDGSFKDTSK